jgi:hypothetical protein
MAVTLYRQVGKGKARRYQKVNLGRGRRPSDREYYSNSPRTRVSGRDPRLPEGQGRRVRRSAGTCQQQQPSTLRIKPGNRHGGFLAREARISRSRL